MASRGHQRRIIFLVIRKSMQILVHSPDAFKKYQLSSKVPSRQVFFFSKMHDVTNTTLVLVGYRNKTHAAYKIESCEPAHQK